MRRHLLKIVFALAAVGLGLAVPLIAYGNELADSLRLSAAACEAAILLLLVAAMIRVLRFRDRAGEILRRFKAGEFDSLPPTTMRVVGDEVTRANTLLRELGKSLADYEALRCERVALHYRSLETLLRRTTQAVFSVDLKQATIRLNPAACALFGLETDTYPFEVLRGRPANAEFLAVVEDAFREALAPRTETVPLEFPAGNRGVRVTVACAPVKDRESRIFCGLILVSDAVIEPPAPADSENGTPAPPPEAPANG